MTQRQLADAAGLSVGLVRDLEQGRTRSPRWDSVEALALALGLDDQERARLAASWELERSERAPGRLRVDGRHVNLIGPVEIRVLGPLVAERSGQAIDLGPVRRRMVLALLSLRGDDGAWMSELMNLLWHDSAPGSAPSIIQGHISQLRRLFGGGREAMQSDGLIVWTGTSYQLRSGPSLRLDSDDFAGLVRSGDEAVAAGKPDRACEFYERALELWRGAAVADLDGLQEDPLVVALNRKRSELAVRHADATAPAGDQARALPFLWDARVRASRSARSCTQG